jgi:hypothetical protein
MKKRLAVGEESLTRAAVASGLRPDSMVSLRPDSMVSLRPGSMVSRRLNRIVSLRLNPQRPSSNRQPPSANR